jgi:ribosomal protein S1
MSSETPPEPASEQVEEVVEEKAAADTESAPVPEASSVTFDQIKPKMALKGTVKRTELQGAIIDVGMEHDGLLHISQLSNEPVKNVTDVIKEGDSITVYVLAVDKSSGRLDLTLVEQPNLTWNDIDVNQTYTGTVERIESYGVFIDIGAERPGLIHISELTQGFINDPNEIVSLGDSLEARVIGVNRRKKQIDLSVKALEAEELQELEDEEEEVATAMELALRKAMEASENSKNSDRRSKKRDKKKDKYAEQQEIMARTLRMHQNNN